MTRKCCNTPRGAGPHEAGCRQGQARTLREQFDRDGVTKDARKGILEEVAGDMPDGAYFAMAEEFGLDIEDFIED